MVHAKKKAPARRSAPMHVMLERPVFLRKTILAGAIDATKLLKDIEEYHILQLQKAKAHRLLARSMREIKTGQKHLETEHLPALPGADMVAIKKPATVERPESIMQPPPPLSKPTPKKKEHLTEIDRLNAEIQAIEERIHHL